MSWTQMFVLSVIEGITEYLPISSTGHMILASSIMGINDDDFVKNFEIIVQFGAILAALMLYWNRFLSGWIIYRKLFIAFLPAAVIGLAIKSKIDLILGEGVVVAYALIIGGILLIVLDKRLEKTSQNLEIEKMSDGAALKIGFLQCLAFIPGVSRSAASIMAAMSQGFSKSRAAEFSFLLGIPTLAGATLVKVIKIRHSIHADQIQMLVVGNLIAFIVALVAIKGFVHFLTRHGFRVFGIYRVIVGLAFLYFIE